MLPITLLQRRWLSALIVFLVVCLAHSQAPTTIEFHHDDGHSIVRNPHLQDPANLPRFFASTNMFGENPEDRMYRPLVLAMHSLNFALAGPHPGPFVALNVILHALVASLVTWWLRLSLPALSAVVGGLFFGLHPLQTEVVHYISTRSESMAGLFVTLAIGAFIVSQQHSTSLRTTSSERPQGQPPRKRRMWQAISVVGAVAGLACKATAIVTPALAFLVLMKLDPRRSARDVARACFPFVLISSAYFILHQSLTSSPSNNMVRSMSTQILTQSKALIHYLLSVVMPVRLSIHPQFSPSTHIEMAVFAGTTLVLSLAIVWWWSRDKARWAGIGWFLVCLSPTLLVPLNVLVNDHRPYLALAGLIWLILELTRRVPRGLALAGIAILFILSWQRAPDWHSEMTIWQDAVRKGPQMEISHYNLGFAQHLAGQSDSAAYHYRVALQLAPDYVRPMNNLGALLRGANQMPEALRWLRKAADLEPENPEVLNNLGLVLTGMGNAVQAIPVLHRASRLAPDIGEIWLNLGLAQRDAGRRTEAMRSLQRALQLDPALSQRIRPGGQ